MLHGYGWLSGCGSHYRSRRWNRNGTGLSNSGRFRRSDTLDRLLHDGLSRDSRIALHRRSAAGIVRY